MNYLATLPPKKRFYTALVCLPLMYLIIKGMVLGLSWANSHADIPAVLMVGAVAIVAIVKIQRIAAAIVSFFAPSL